MPACGWAFPRLSSTPADTLIYHILGGEAEYTHPTPGAAPIAAFPLGNVIRTLFLNTATGGGGSSGGIWSTPGFADEVANVVADLDPTEAVDAANVLAGIREAAFSPAAGTLTWSRGFGSAVVKRGTVASRKWMGTCNLGCTLTRHLPVRPSLFLATHTLSGAPFLRAIFGAC